MVKLGLMELRQCLLIQLFLPYPDSLEARLSVQGGKWSTEVDLELVLHKSNVRVKATVAVVNVKMEPSEDSFDGKPSVGLMSLLFP